MILGSVFGIRVRVHPSWLIIFGLLVASLVSWVQAPGPYQLSAGPSLVVAIVVALLFFASVIAHELAHALVARRRGLEVSEISLFVLGGAAGTRSEPDSAASEGLIAAAGPLVSIVTGGIFLGVSELLTGEGGDGIRIGYWMAWWLGVSNLLFAAFNLIPGFPMDGGRILRAISWAITRDFVQATRISSAVGRGFAYVLIFGGFLLALQGGLSAGLWLVLVGWFLNRAAKGSYNQTRLEQLVEGMHVSDAVQRDGPVVRPSLTLDTLIGQHELGDDAAVYPVSVDGELVGAVDVVRASRLPRKRWSTTRVTDVMTSGDQLITFTEQQPLMDVVARFEETGADAFPVVDAADPRRLLGMVTRVGVLNVMRSRDARRGDAPVR